MKTDNEQISDLRAEIRWLKQQRVPPHMRGYVDEPTPEELRSTSSGMMVNGVWVRNPFKGLSNKAAERLADAMQGRIR